MSNHIIHKQNVTLKIQEVTEAWKLQDRLSQLYKTRLNRDLESALNGLCDEDEYIRIDKLELDLGTLSSINFETEFRERLSAEFSKVLSGIKYSPGENVKILQKAETGLDSLMYFLEYGCLPWYTDIKKIKDWEENLLLSLSPSEWNYLFQWLDEKNITSGRFIERLVLQFSDNFLFFILYSFKPTIRDFSSSVFNDIFILIKLLTKDTNELIRAKIWISIFAKSKQITNTEEFIIKVLKLNLFTGDIFIPFKALSPPLKKVVIELITETNVSRPVFDTAISVILSLNLKTVGEIEQLTYDTLIEFSNQGIGIFDDIKSEVVRTTFLKIFKEELQNEIAEEISNDISPTESEESGVEETTKRPNEKKNMSPKKMNALLERDGIYVLNCGIVLLHPFLLDYFTATGQYSDGAFISEESRKRAPLLLNFLATGTNNAQEFDLVFQKILCGINMDEPIPSSIELPEKEIEEAENLLNAVICHWPPLNRTSIDGLRTSFLQREGKLTKTENGWRLYTENKAIDILLDKLPWGYSTIKLPWMDYILNVDWR